MSDKKHIADAERFRELQAAELIKSIVVVVGRRRVQAYVEQPDGTFVPNPEVDRLLRAARIKRSRK